MKRMPRRASAMSLIFCVISCVLVLVGGVTGASAGSGVVHHVDQFATSGGDGASWASAYSDLKEALSSAVAGDEIWVAEGRYRGGFIVPAGVVLLGGFEAGATRASQRRPFTHITALDGGSSERVLLLGNEVVLDGFLIQFGHAALGGGGAMIDGTNPTIRHCAFRSNKNIGGRGSALAVQNRANPTVESSVFFDNIGNGHVIDVDNADGVFNHIVVYKNRSNGFHIQRGSSPIIMNSVFGRNGGRGICDISPSDNPIVVNNVFHNNGVSLYHYLGRELRSIGQVNGLSYAQNNLDGDPGFRNADRSDYRIRSDSLCVDAGTLTELSDLYDPLRNSRWLDGDLDSVIAPDIGIHEFSHVALEVIGEVRPGATVQVRATGTPGLLLAFTIGNVASTPSLIDPIGYWFVDPRSAMVIDGGTIPFDEMIRIPRRMAPGTSFIVQAIGYVDRQKGCFSNAIDLLIR